MSYQYHCISGATILNEIRAMKTFKNHDEKTHPAGTHRYWNESFYLNFFDHDGEWGGAARIGFSPNLGFGEGFILFFFPGGATGFIRAWEGLPDHIGQDRVGPFVHECVEPFKTWRFRYQGPIFYFQEPAAMGDFSRTMLHDLPSKQIKIDLEFEAVHDIFDFHQSMKKEFITGRKFLKKLKPKYFLNHLGPGLRKAALLRTMSGAQHYEHAGRIKGKIVVDSEEHDFSGFGQRDHSWGVRDMRVPTNWRWFSGQFKDDLCFNAIKVEILAFRASGGYVYHKGKAEALADWSYSAEFSDSERWAKRIVLQLQTCSGKRFEVSGEALANIPVIVNTGGYVQVVNEAMARIKCDGKIGLGVSEFMEQLI